MYAQSLSATEQARLAPRLRPVAAQAPDRQSMRPLLPRGGRVSSPRRYAVFVRTRDLDVLRTTGLSVHAAGAGLATARVTAAGLRTLARTEGVTSVRPARTYTPMNDIVREAAGIQPVQAGALGRRYTGAGVLVCVIDTGIDWAHPDFRGVDDSSRSRVRALWDQTLAPRPSGRAPVAFGYGVEYTRRDIEDEIDGTPAGQVRSIDPNGHGTHLAGTVAGNGAASAGRTQRGMAPDADIVAVKTDFTGVGIADGLSYCGAKAEEVDRPVVVTLGLGTMAGPHDGSSALARVIDDFVGPGRSVVVAAGNGGDARRHVATRLSPGSADSLQIRVPRYTPAAGAGNDVAFHLDAWTGGRLRGPTLLVTPTGTTVPLTADTAAAVQTGDGTVVYEHTRRPDGDHHIEVIVQDADAARPPASGTWRLATRNAGMSATTVHGWLVETTTATTLEGGDRHSTITTPATAHRALAVGAWAHRRTMGRADASPVAPFSGRGPLRSRGQKPDLVAPGGDTRSARARAVPGAESRTGQYAWRRGTSTAAATAAGAVALLFQHAPSLSGERAAAILRETARAGDKGGWGPGRGHGALDLYRAMAVLQGRTVATRDRLAYDEPVPAGDRTEHALGGAGASAMAVRVTPPRSGALQALSLRTVPGTTSRLRDSLTVSVWTDENGRPGRRLGVPVRIAPEVFTDSSTTVVSIAETEVVVERGTDYHVVVEPGGDGTLIVAGEQRSVDGRSSVRRRGEWTPLTTADLAMQVSTAFALDLEAPRPTAPASGTLLDATKPVPLSWAAVPDAGRYTVQVASAPQFPPGRTDTLRSNTASTTVRGLAPSRAYYWRVRAERREYAGPWSRARSFVRYPATIDVSLARAFGAEGGSGGYRLVALPGRRAIPLARTMEGRPGTDWQAVWDRGTSTEPFVTFDGSDRFRFGPGTGFWLRSDRPWRVRTTVPTVPLSDDGTYTIPLHDGWNVIANPFELDVSWAAVRAANDGPLPPLWRYEGRFESASTFASARTGEAFYLLNDAGREGLRLPYPARPGGPAKAAAKTERPPALTLTAHQNDRRAARVQVGVHEDARDGRDRYDRVAPPARFAPVALHLDAEGADGPPRQRRLAAEYRSATDDGHTFSLTLRAEAGAPVELRADGLEVFDGQQVVLVDPATGTSYDLRATSTITLRPAEGPRSLRVLVGPPDYVAAKKKVTLPDDLRFFPNYPNPFRDQTTLEYVLPDPGPVRLAVYDVLGRQVRVLIDEKQQGGRHAVQWDGRDESGRRLASGVYLARLVVGGTTKVRKMTFVR